MDSKLPLSEISRFALLFGGAVCFCFGQIVFTGAPDPFTADASGLGQITLAWTAPGVSVAEVHLLSPTGPLFTRGSSSGLAETGVWVTDGMTFYLQDVSASATGTTLATYTAHSSGTLGLPSDTKLLVSTNDGQQLFYKVTGPTLVEIHLFNPSGPLLARLGPGQAFVDTGTWITDGMRFFLQDVSGGNPLTYQYTVATGVATVNPSSPGKPGVIFGPTPGIVLDSKDTGLATAGLYWNAPGTALVQVRVNSPDGPLFAETGGYGFGDMTGWVTDGMHLYLQDASSGDPTSAANTLAISTIDLQPPVQHYVAFYQPSLGIQLNSRDSGHLLGSIPLPGSVTAWDVKTGPDGTLIYVAGSDGNIYVLDPFTLTIKSTIQLTANFPSGIYPLTWIKNRLGTDLILVGPDTVGGNFYAVDPSLGTITNTIVCGCPGTLPTYDPFNRTTYLTSFPYDFGVDQVMVPTITPDLAMGPSITLATPFSSYVFGLGLSIVPLNAGTQGQLLLTWEKLPIDGFAGPSTEASYVYDLTTGTTTDAELSSQDGNSYEESRSSPDGRSVYSQEIAPYLLGSGGIPRYGYTYGPFSLFQLSQTPGGVPILSKTATTSLPASNVLLPTIAYDDEFVYLQWEAGLFDLSGGFQAEGPIYIYKADPKTLQPAGTTAFIDTGSNSFNPFSLALGSYVFCTSSETPGCSP